MLSFLETNWRTIVEILLLAPVVYGLYRLFRVTRAARIVVVSILVLFVLSIIAERLELSTIHWVLRTGSLGFIMALVVLFQPELRRSFAEFGSKLFKLNRYQPETLDVLVEAAQSLSRKRFGALFAIERRMDLDTHAETGVEIDALVTQELISSVFHPRTALHDGGMILDEDRIRAAACVFPLSHRELTDRTLGLRHRAAIGLSEVSDCLCIVVSEESGQISLAMAGELHKGIEPEELRDTLRSLLLSRDGDPESKVLEDDE